MTHKLRHLIISLVLIAALAVPGCKATGAPSSPEAKASYLVLVVIDGCRADYLSTPEIPNIKKLMSEGASYSEAWVGQQRNNTPPSHTSISTGAFPKNHGVIAFGWSQSLGNLVQPTDWDSVTSGALNRIIASSGVTSIGTLYKKSHPQAKVAAISSDKYYAAAGLGAESADFILFNWAKNTSPQSSGVAGTPLFPFGVSGHLAPLDIMNDPKLATKGVKAWDWDTWVIDVALKLMAQEKPEIMLINLSATDGIGHGEGASITARNMEPTIVNADRQIGRLIDAYKKAGIYDKTLFVITGDHGMANRTYLIKWETINDIVLKLGAKPLNKNSQFYISDPNQSVKVAEGISQAKIPGVSSVYYKVKTANGNFSYLPSPSTAREITGELDKCYRYLTSTYASERSPDIHLVLAEDWDLDVGSKLKGQHDTATWSTQQIPLVIAGPGVKTGAQLNSPARLVDIAPTVLTLMGIQPEHMDGIVLADTLLSPTKTQLKSQEKVIQELAPLTTALKARSEADLKAQANAK